MPSFIHVLEADDYWCCRVGNYTVDEHNARDEAVEHATSLARSHRPSVVILHEVGASAAFIGGFS